MALLTKAFVLNSNIVRLNRIKMLNEIDVLIIILCEINSWNVAQKRMAFSRLQLI